MMYRINNCIGYGENSFTDSKQRKSINVIFPATEFGVTTNFGGVFAKSAFSVVVERLGSQELLQMRLCDLSEKAKMYITTIDGGSFEQMKQDQSLHVTFTGFVDNLISILNHSSKGLLQIRLTQDKEQQYMLQFFEVRSFKNLVHLSLPFHEASMAIVFYHVNEAINALQKQQGVHESTILHMEAELSKKDDQINYLKNDIEKLKANFEDERKLLNSRDNEEIKQLQKVIKNVSQTKESDKQHFKQMITNLQNQLEHVSVENSALKEQKMQEIRKNEALRDEISAVKLRTAGFKEQNEKLIGEIASLKNLEEKNGIHASELRKQAQELRNALEKLQKLNSEYSAALEAERKICQTKRNALQMASEEIAKANDIILKQSKEITDLRKTVDWRTEVALQQEVTIRNKEKEICLQKEKIKMFETELKTTAEESERFRHQIQVMEQLASKIETKYSSKICELGEKISILLKDRSEKRIYK